MMLYVREQGIMLGKRGGLLCATKGGKTVLEQRLGNLDGVAVFGNVQISTQALEMLLAAGIDVSYFSYSGKFLGHLAADEAKNIFLRLAQYDLYQSAEKRFRIARRIVDNKISNQLSIIKGYQWTSDYDWKKDTEEIEKIQSGLWKDSGGDEEFESDSKSKLDPSSRSEADPPCKGEKSDATRDVSEDFKAGHLLGIEGICSRIYFRAFGHMFLSDIRFTKRSRRPPKDPANVILSLAYTMLTKEVENALSMASFEVSLGFLHGVRYGRKSLALDIVEEFRQPLADRLVLKLLNKQMLTLDDFEFTGDGVILTEDGFRSFFRAYEKWMNGSDRTSGVDSFRSSIRIQADKLKAAVQNGAMYEPFAWRV